MLVKFLTILLLILEIIQLKISVYGTPKGQDKVKFFEHNCDNTLEELHHEETLTIKFNQLEKYETRQKQYNNVRFSEIKIVKLSWGSMKEKAINSDELCGLGLKTVKKELVKYDNESTSYINIKDNYHISYSNEYLKGNNFEDYVEAGILCNIHQCDMGLLFFDENKNAETLNNVNKIHMVDHAVLVVIESKDNKMLLGTVLYHKVDIILGICPYINWVPKKGLLEFIPEEDIKDNGYFEKENDKAHIVVPFYKKNEDSDKFFCGKLKQPTMPDLLIGYKLEEYISDKEITGVINPLENELKCEHSDNPQHHYHFGYLEKSTNYMSERIMETVTVHDHNSTHKFYAGQKIYIYNRDNVKKGLKNGDNHERLTEPHVYEEVLCIKNLKSNIKASILPTIGSLDSIKKHEVKNIFYRIIKSDDLGKEYSFRCLTKVEEESKGHMEEFYSRSAEFIVENGGKPTVLSTLFQNTITFIPKKINNYGSYRCTDIKATSLFDKNFITMDEVYYLPDEDSEMELKETPVVDIYQSNVGCNKEYGTIGKIKKMIIRFAQNVSDPIIISNFTDGTDTIDIKEGKIIYKKLEDVHGVTVKCTYETPAETTFYTTKTTIIKKIQDTGTEDRTIPKEKALTNVKLNSAPWIIGIMVSVILFGIILCVVVFLIIRKIKKTKARNSLASSSSSGLSTLSKSKESKSSASPIHDKSSYESVKLIAN